MREQIGLFSMPLKLLHPVMVTCVSRRTTDGSVPGQESKNAQATVGNLSARERTYADFKSPFHIPIISLIGGPSSIVILRVNVATKGNEQLQNAVISCSGSKVQGCLAIFLGIVDSCTKLKQLLTLLEVPIVHSLSELRVGGLISTSTPARATGLLTTTCLRLCGGGS